jgi:hypothetical protein
MKRLVALILATLLASPALASTPQPSNTTCRLLSAAASVNATSCTAQTTLVGTIVGFNASASGRWLKIYDKATAPASTDTPRESYYLPPSTAFAFDVNNYFASGLGFRLTTGSADNDTGALTSGDVLGLNIDLR